MMTFLPIQHTSLTAEGGQLSKTRIVTPDTHEHKANFISGKERKKEEKGGKKINNERIR